MVASSEVYDGLDALVECPSRGAAELSAGISAKLSNCAFLPGFLEDVEEEICYNLLRGIGWAGVSGVFFICTAIICLRCSIMLEPIVDHRLPTFVDISEAGLELEEPGKEHRRKKRRAWTIKKLGDTGISLLEDVPGPYKGYSDIMRSQHLEES